MKLKKFHLLTNKVFILSIILFLVLTNIILFQRNDVMVMKHWLELVLIEGLTQLIIHYIQKQDK